MTLIAGVQLRNIQIMMYQVRKIGGVFFPTDTIETNSSTHFWNGYIEYQRTDEISKKNIQWISRVTLIRHFSFRWCLPFFLHLSPLFNQLKTDYDKIGKIHWKWGFFVANCTEEQQHAMQRDFLCFNVLIPRFTKDLSKAKSFVWNYLYIRKWRSASCR